MNGLDDELWLDPGLDLGGLGGLPSDFAHQVRFFFPPFPKLWVRFLFGTSPRRMRLQPNDGPSCGAPKWAGWVSFSLDGLRLALAGSLWGQPSDEQEKPKGELPFCLSSSLSPTKTVAALPILRPPLRGPSTMASWTGTRLARVGALGRGGSPPNNNIVCSHHGEATVV